VVNHRSCFETVVLCSSVVVIPNEQHVELELIPSVGFALPVVGYHCVHVPEGLENFLAVFPREQGFAFLPHGGGVRG
jgi:hypothetical protein